MRFTAIDSYKDINADEFKFNRTLYKDYRIEEWLDEGLVTTQEAFINAPNICGITQKGESVNLYQNKSKIYILDFWFVNCPTCIVAKRFIEKEIIPKYSTSDIMVLGVNPIDKSFAAVEKAMKEEVLQYPYILNKEAAAVQYHLSAYPGISILNSKFEVIRSYNSFGSRVGEEILELINLNLN